MVCNEIIKGKFCQLRSIEISDAEFSYNLRNTSDVVGVHAESVEAQRKFIEQQREKEGDYYFVVEDLDGNPIGLYGVYDIIGDSAEVGREINIGSPMQTMEAPYIATVWAYEKLGINELRSVVYKENKKQISNSIKLGRKTIGEVVRSGKEAFEYRLSFDEWLKGEQKMLTKLEKIYKNSQS